MKSIFEENLLKQGFVFKETSMGYYNITPKNRIVQPVSLRLVISRPINEIIHGSQNGNDIDAIGYFHFNLNSEPLSNYLVFTFKHLRNDTTQYMIITTKELRKRLMKNLITYRNGEHLEFRIWQIDGYIFDSSAVSLEAEWFYLSKGRGGGRMIDSTDWNYTKFLNNWDFGFGSRE